MIVSCCLPVIGSRITIVINVPIYLVINSRNQIKRFDVDDNGIPNIVLISICVDIDLSCHIGVISSSVVATGIVATCVVSSGVIPTGIISACTVVNPETVNI